MLGRVGERFLDDAAVAVEVGELREHRGFEPVLGEPVAVALARAVLVAGGAGVVGVAAVSSVGARADVGAAALVATHEPGEQEVTWVAAAKRGVFAAAAEDFLRGFEGLRFDERVVEAWMRFAVPADEAAVRGVRQDELERVR
ncbi:MAG TPA: hypothetical protein VFA05_02005 [Gaiellaceae bacterium]|nr:hypothetical protein [Gaiellaceae bacterium]